MPLLTMVWMYMTPVVYGLNSVPKRYLTAYMMNPMSAVMDGFRGAVLEGRLPNWHYLGIAAGVSVVFLIVGYRTFKRLEPAFAETI